MSRRRRRPAAFLTCLALSVTLLVVTAPSQAFAARNGTATGYRFPHGGYLGSYTVNDQFGFDIDLNSAGASTAGGYRSSVGSSIRKQVGWTPGHENGNAGSITGDLMTPVELAQAAYLADRYAATQSAATAAAAEQVMRELTMGDGAQRDRETVRWAQAVAAHPTLPAAADLIRTEVAKRSGPYRLVTGWTTTPTIAVPGVLTVQVLSATGTPMTGVQIGLRYTGAVRGSSVSGSTGTGTASLTVPVTSLGTLEVTATATALPSAVPILYTPKGFTNPRSRDYSAQRMIGSGRRGTVSGTATAEITAVAPIVTTAVVASTVPAGSDLADTVTLKGSAPGYQQSVTASLWGPFTKKPTATDCTGTPAGTATLAVTGDGTYTTDPITAPGPGYYTWTEDFPGTATQLATTSTCADKAEISQVSPLIVPKISTTVAAASVQAGGDLADTVVVKGSAPGYAGTVTASLWGPFTRKPTATDCAAQGTPTGTVTFDVAADGTYTTDPITSAGPGYYTWTEDFPGTPAQAAVTTPCAVGTEISQVKPPVTAKVSTVATPAIAAVGADLTDVITVKGSATGYSDTVTASLWGPFSGRPGPTDCAAQPAPVGQVTVPVAGDGSVTTPPLTVPEAGYYTWTEDFPASVAQTALTTPCAATGETVVVQAVPTVNLSTVGTLAAGDDHHAELDVSGTFPGYAPNATVALYGPFATAPVAGSCARPKLVASAALPVTGDGVYDTDDLTLGNVGTYSWTVTVPGNATQQTVALACGSPSGTFTITRADIGALTLGSTASGGAGTPSGTVPTARGAQLDIPSVGIAAPLVRVSRNGNDIATPADPSLAGQFDEGAVALDPFGTIVISGRASDPTGTAGALGPLATVAAGAKVTLIDVYGKTQKFVVDSVTTASRSVDIDATLLTQTDPLRLVIFSATTPVSYGPGGSLVTYRDNVIVVCSPG